MVFITGAYHILKLSSVRVLHAADSAGLGASAVQWLQIQELEPSIFNYYLMAACRYTEPAGFGKAVIVVNWVACFAYS